MSELEPLGEALRERLHALVGDLRPSADLLAMVDAIPEVSRRSWLRRQLTKRRIALTVPVPIAAIATAALLLFGGASPTTSLGNGITWLPNGEVRMNMGEYLHIAEANADLRRHGLHGLVIEPMTDACPYRNFSYTMGVGPWPVNLFIPNKSWKGWVIVQAAKKIGRFDLSAAGRFRPGHVPPCVSSHGWGAGMGDGHGYKIWPAPKGQQG